MAIPHPAPSAQKAWHISPLARRLVLATVVFGTLVALLTTAIQLYVDYRRELDLDTGIAAV